MADTYWLASLDGAKATVDGAEERDRWTRRHGWQETTAPRDGDRVWMTHPDVQNPALIAWGARAYWTGIGWQPSAPPEPVDLTRDQSLRDVAAAGPDEVPDGTVDDVLGWVGDDPTRAEQALKAERGRDKPRTTLVDALERRGQQEQDSSAAGAATSNEE